ncbi:alpha/beta fold hydrolase [Bacterioplanes sanyensis]|uniref:alpha/beta fold hydrolase n=1 Tax=Bacterioplanes sanyensis TaxID=1249553 RepID=UPI0012FD7E59|nr:alpha/beta fold hydrolase [Bacterioplanes sanyensis]
MSCQPLQHNGNGPNWVWWPGWSFTPEVFESLYQQLPGQHYGVSFPNKPVDSTSFIDRLLDSIPQHAIWVGWSLGGALALRAAQMLAPDPCCHTLVTVATGRRFIADKGPNENADDGQSGGMDLSTYQTFAQQLQQQPQRTAQRFVSLACKGASDARQRARLLLPYQLTDANVLQHTLRWLEYDALPDNQAQHWRGADDALQPSGFHHITVGSSHAPFAGQDQPRFLQRLQQLAEATAHA